jgi:hypothetical protein
MADAVMKRDPDASKVDGNRWEYTPGLMMKAMFDVAQRTGDDRYFDYAKSYYDAFIAPDGTIRGGYNKDDYNIDRINPGKPLFLLYAKTKDERYRKAIETLRQQMREHPRTSEGGFWHKKRYPYQMWLDGLYMGAPFLAQYAKTFHEPALFDDVINQYVLMEKHARDEKTGLLVHGWDEKRAQKWADPTTGRSPAFWGRAMGWYAMGLVETLDRILGTRDGLVRDGTRRDARLRAARSSAPRRADRDPATTRRSDRESAGPEDGRVVASRRSAGTRRQLSRVLRRHDVRLRSPQVHAPRLHRSVLSHCRTPRVRRHHQELHHR